MNERHESTDEWEMVGRTEELDLVIAHIEQGSNGVLLTGAAGTGKSRLAREAMTIAGQRLDTGSFACTRATFDVPYATARVFASGIAAGEDSHNQILTHLRSRSSRLVVFFDDVDQLDRMSMALVHQALSEGLIVLVATVRTGLERNPDVIAFWKDFGLRRVEIQPLARADVAAMLAAGLGGNVDGAAVKQIWTVAAGVPLFVRELVRHAIAEGVLIVERGVWRLTAELPTPSSLAELVQMRLDGLQAAATEAAQIMGAAEALGAELLLSIIDADTIEQLEDEGIIELLDEEYRLTHPLFGDVLRGTMSATRLRRVLARLADLVESRGLDHVDDLIRVASWRLRSGDRNNASVMNRAAHATYRSGDFALARQLSEAAHDGGVLEGSLLLAQILHETGSHDEAEKINVSIDLSQATEVENQRAVVQRAVNLFFGLGKGPEALTVLEKTRQLMPYNRSWFLLNMARVDEARQALRGHEADARSFLVSSAWVAALGGQGDQALRHLDELDAKNLEPSIAPSRFRDFPELPRVLALLELGRLNEAESEAEAGHEASVDRHPDFIRAWWLFLLGRINTDRGRIRAACSYLQQGEALQASLNQTGLMRWCLGAAAYASGQTNDVSETERLVRQCREIGPRDERAFSYLATGAESWLNVRTAGTTSAARGLISAGDAEADLGSTSAARRLWFDAVRVGGAVAVDGRLDDGPSDFDRVRAAAAAAQVDSNGPAMSEVAEALSTSGANLWAAEAWTAAGAFHVASGRQRLATSAARAADVARQLCQEVATPGLAVERTAVALTSREREVLVMAAGGTQSRDIAESLFISVRTVNNLIQRSYVKLGVSSRAEAAVSLGIDTGK